MTIGSTLKALRTARGLSQQQVADCLGLTNSSVSQMEHDAHGLTVSSLYTLAELYGVHPSEILGDVPHELSTALSRPLLLRIVQSCADATDEQLQLVLGILMNFRKDAPIGDNVCARPALNELTQLLSTYSDKQLLKLLDVLKNFHTEV